MNSYSIRVDYEEWRGIHEVMKHTIRMYDMRVGILDARARSFQERLHRGHHTTTDTARPVRVELAHHFCRL